MLGKKCIFSLSAQNFIKSWCLKCQAIGFGWSVQITVIQVLRVPILVYEVLSLLLIIVFLHKGCAAICFEAWNISLTI